MDGKGEVVVEARNISQTLSSGLTIDEIGLSIMRGECFGFLGRAGAGKSSILRLLYCASTVSSGSLFINGLNSREHARHIKKKIGVVPQDAELDEDFSVLENLLIYCRFFRIKKNVAEEKSRELLREMELEETADLSVTCLSSEIRRRLAICRALLNEPEILFIDEPTLGLDFSTRQWIWRLLLKLKNRLGVTVVLATQSREEAEALCDRVALVDHGKILKEGSPTELVKDVVGPEVLEFLCSYKEMDYYITRLQGRYNYQVHQNKVRLFLQEDQESKIAMNFVPQENVVIRRTCLDDVFLKLTGRDLREL